MYYLVFINRAGVYKFKTKSKDRLIVTTHRPYARVYKTKSEARKVALATMFRLQEQGFTHRQQFVGWATFGVEDFETVGKEELKYLCEAAREGAFDE